MKQIVQKIVLFNLVKKELHTAFGNGRGSGANAGRSLESCCCSMIFGWVEGFESVVGAGRGVDASRVGGVTGELCPWRFLQASHQ